jgi:hypothetical protein
MSAAQVAILLGLLLIADAAVLRFRTDWAHRALLAYPRMRLPALIFTGLSLLWFAWNLWQVDFGGLSGLKRLLVVAVPAGWYLIVTYIPDLLAVRSLCTLLLLAGNPLLVQVRWQGAPSWALGILIYAVMLKAMLLAVYPHLWKRGVHWLFAKPARLRAACGAGALTGLLLLLTVFAAGS